MRSGVASITRLGALLACLGVVASAWTAVPVPPEVEHSEPEVQARYMSQEADRSLEEKLKVGKQRYEQRKAFRSALVTNLRANAEQRMEFILGETEPAAAQDGTAKRTNWALVFCFFVAGAGGALLFCSRKKATEPA